MLIVRAVLTKQRGISHILPLPNMLGSTLIIIYYKYRKDTILDNCYLKIVKTKPWPDSPPHQKKNNGRPIEKTKCR